MRLVGWRWGEHADEFHAGQSIDVVIEPKLNSWQGRESMEGVIRDVRVHRLIEEHPLGSAAAAGASSDVAERAIRLLERPTEITPTAPSQADINRPFYDERNVFVQGSKGSAWSLTVEEYRSLPPISLDAPGFTQLQDFDAPAGLRPALSRIDGFIPRDTRRVELKAEERGEFED